MRTGPQTDLRDRACPLCGSRDQSAVFAPEAVDESRLDAFAYASRKTPEYMHYRLISCPDCDLLYASPAPAPGALAAAYREAAFDSSEESRFAARTYARLLSGILDRLPGRGGALDIGAGDGAFLRELLALGFTGVAGVEPSEAPIAAASAEVRPLIRRGVFAAADFQEGTLSLATSFQTLEHVADPLGVCRDARRLLKEGGAAFFICHDRRAWSARLLGLKSPIFDVEHLQLFSPASARALLERAGFEDIEVRPIWNRYPLHYWLRLLPLPPSWKERLVSRTKAAAFGSRLLALPAGNLAAIGFKRRARAAGAEPSPGQFGKDMERNQGYLYTTNARFSSLAANRRLTEAVLDGIAEFDADGGIKSLIDIGCGDGTYTAQIKEAFPQLEVKGFDPVESAVQAAKSKFPKIEFYAGSIIDETAEAKEPADVAVLRGVLHHLPDPELAIRNAGKLAKRIIIIEPNGWNPILKLIERFSAYHVQHEERSFTSVQLRKWCENAGLDIVSTSYAGFVPFFFPTLPARMIYFIQPLLERTPVLPALFGAVSVIRCVNRAPKA